MYHILEAIIKKMLKKKKKNSNSIPTLNSCYIRKLKWYLFFSQASVDNMFETLVHALVYFLVTAFFLATIMGVRFKRSKKIMPAGLVAGLR